MLLVVAHQPNVADIASLLDAEPTTTIVSDADTAASATDVEFDAGSFESINNNECSGYEDHQLTPTPSPGFVSENELQQQHAYHGLQQLELCQPQQQQLNQREVVLTEDDYDDDTDPDSGTGTSSCRWLAHILNVMFGWESLTTCSSSSNVPF